MCVRSGYRPPRGRPGCLDGMEGSRPTLAEQITGVRDEVEGRGSGKLRLPDTLGSEKFGSSRRGYVAMDVSATMSALFRRTGGVGFRCRAREALTHVLWFAHCDPIFLLTISINLLCIRRR